jgi:glutathione S-transferase
VDRLITIPISHYCERARWALDHCEVPYEEEQHLQILHKRAVRKVGGVGSVPVLVTRDGVLCHSRHIVRYADAHGTRRLYPEELRADIEAYEHGIDHEFGVETRRWGYLHFFPLRKLLLRYNAGRAPLWERSAVRVSYPLLSRLASRMFRLDDASVARGRPIIDRYLDQTAAMLADGRPYLFGDRFTAADLTFAAMLAPIVLPLHYGMPMPRPDELPSATRAKVEAFRAHPAAQFGLRMFAEHRRSG